jgi:hypothetical protein
VGDAGSEVPATLRYDLRLRPPVATFAVAAATTVVGCGLMAIYGIRSRGAVLLVAAVAVLIFGLVLAGGAVLFLVRFRTVVELRPDSVTVRRGSREQVLSWTKIKNVSLEGPRLTLHVKGGEAGDVVVINPRSAADPVFMSLMAALSQRLDASRGYGSAG